MPPVDVYEAMRTLRAVLAFHRAKRAQATIVLTPVEEKK